MTEPIQPVQQKPDWESYDHPEEHVDDTDDPENEKCNHNSASKNSTQKLFSPQVKWKHRNPQPKLKRKDNKQHNRKYVVHRPLLHPLVLFHETGSLKRQHTPNEFCKLIRVEMQPLFASSVNLHGRGFRVETVQKHIVRDAVKDRFENPSSHHDIGCTWLPDAKNDELS